MDPPLTSTKLPPVLFPPPWSSPPLGDSIISGKDNQVTDNGLRSAIVVDLVIGTVCIVAFVALSTQSVLYKFRLVSPTVTVKPPPLPTGVSAMWGWLVATLTVSDQELLQSCGLDALMFVKMLTYGVQLFTPVALLSIAVLLPLHMTGHYLEDNPSTGNQASFMRTTMTNVAVGSDVLWVHCIFVLLFITWGCWLLKWHMHQYVTIRQHWLRTGDDVNEWRALYEETQRMLPEPTPGDVFTSVLQQLTNTKLGMALKQGLDSAAAAANKLNPLSGPSAHGPGSAQSVFAGSPASAPTHAGSQDLPTPGKVEGHSGVGSNETLINVAEEEEEEGEGRSLAQFHKSATMRRRRRHGRNAAADAAVSADNQRRSLSGAPSDLGPPPPPGGAARRALQRRASGVVHADGTAFTGTLPDLQRLLEEELGERPVDSAAAPDPPPSSRGGPMSRIVDSGRLLSRFMTMPSPRRMTANSSSQEIGLPKLADPSNDGGSRRVTQNGGMNPPLILTENISGPPPDRYSTGQVPVDAIQVVVHMDGGGGGDGGGAPTLLPRADTLPRVDTPETPVMGGPNPGLSDTSPPGGAVAGKGIRRASQDVHGYMAVPSSDTPQRAPHAPVVPTGVPPLPPIVTPGPGPALTHSLPHEYAPVPQTPVRPGHRHTSSESVIQLQPLHLPHGGSPGNGGDSTARSGEACRRSPNGGHQVWFTGHNAALALGLNASSSERAPQGQGGSRAADTPSRKGSALPNATASENLTCQLSELPRWWASNAAPKYDPNAVMKQRASRRGHHRRTGSAGHGSGGAASSMPRTFSGASSGGTGTMTRGSVRLESAGTSGNDGHASLPRHSGHNSFGGGARANLYGNGSVVALVRPPSTSGTGQWLGPCEEISGADGRSSRRGLRTSPAPAFGSGGRSQSQGAFGAHDTAADAAARIWEEVAAEAAGQGHGDTQGEAPVPLPPMLGRGSRDGQGDGGGSRRSRKQLGSAGPSDQPGHDDGDDVHGDGDEWLARPSVRHLKTVNTINRWGEEVAVNAQQYAVLVTDVNQNLWTCKELWPKPSTQEGQGALSWFIPGWARTWVMSNYAVQALNLYDQSDEDEDPLDEEEHVWNKGEGWGEGDQRTTGPTTTATATPTSARPATPFGGGDPQSPAVALNLAARDQGLAGAEGAGAGTATAPAATAIGASLSEWGGAVQGGSTVPALPAASTARLNGPMSQPLGEAAETLMGPSSDPLQGGKDDKANGAADSITSAAPDGTDASKVGPDRDGSKVGADDESKGPEDADGSKAGTQVARVASARRRRARERWGVAREAVLDGRVVGLLLSARRYSVVTATFKRLFPGDFDRAIPIISHKEVDQLLLRLDQHHNLFTLAESQSRRTGQPPRGRLRLCGLLGPKVNLLEYHTQQMNELQEQIKVARQKTIASGHAPSWLVFFRSQTAAAVCAQSVIHSEDNREFKVRAAPGPEEVNWPALWMTFIQRDLRAWIVQPLLILLILIPVGVFAGGAMQLEYLFCPLGTCTGVDPVTNTTLITYTRSECPPNSTISFPTEASQAFKWDWYCAKDSWISSLLSTLITGWLPSLLLMLWQNMVLPLAMLLLAQASGRCYSYSMMDQMIASHIFWFNLFQSFLGGILGSALVQQVSSLFESGPAQVLNILGNYLPSSSNFFVAYMMLRTFALLPLKLLIPHIGIRMYLFRRYLFRCTSSPLTAREYAFLYANTSPRIGFEYGMTMLTFLIPMTYAVLSPVLAVLGLGYFAVSWIVWRYCYLYVFVRKYESGGLMWRFMYGRMLVIFGLFGLFTACVLIVKQAYPQAIVLFVLVPLILVRFSSFIFFRFLEALDHVPLTMARNGPRAIVDPSCYIPPPLQPGSRGWHPEWAKPWQGWQLPTGYGVV